MGVPARSLSLRSRTSSALSVRSSRTTKLPSSANSSASSLMRRTTSPTWTSSTSSLPLPTKCLCSSNNTKEQFRSRNKKNEQRLGKTTEEQKKKNVRTNTFRMNFKLNLEWDSLDSCSVLNFDVNLITFVYTYI